MAADVVVVIPISNLSWALKNSVGMTGVRSQFHGLILRAFTTHRNGPNGPVRVRSLRGFHSTPRARSSAV
jgi:hypothetical protein